MLASDLLEDVGFVVRWAGTANTMPGILAVIHAFLAEYYCCLDAMPDALDVENDAVWQRLRFALSRTKAQPDGVKVRTVGHGQAW